MKSVHYRGIGFDPAIKNFGYSVVELRGDHAAWRVLECGLLTSPIQELTTEIRLDIRPFMTELDGLFRRVEPDILAIERFQNRSRLGASQTEKVNIMIGMSLQRAVNNSVDVAAYTASAWKNRVTPHYDLNDIYAHARKHMRRRCNEAKASKEYTTKLVAMTPHCIDSTIMSLYTVCTKHKVKPWRWVDLVLAERVVNRLFNGSAI